MQFLAPLSNEAEQDALLDMDHPQSEGFEGCGKLGSKNELPGGSTYSMTDKFYF